MPTTKRSTTPPDAIRVLKDDHAEVEQLFKRFEQLGPKASATKRKVADRVIEALSVHAGIEETVLYPAIREQMPDAESDVLEALEEHHLVKTVLAELARTQPDDERFVPKMTVLMENVRHHVKEEERDLFKQMRASMSKGDLTDLGTALRGARKTAPKRPHPHASDTPPGNLVATAITAPLDAALAIGETAANAVRPRRRS